MLIRNREFGGERPKLSPRLIGESDAQIALDCELTAHELRPILENRYVDAAPFNAETLFIVDDQIVTFAGDVQISETPVNAAVRRLFWSGDGFPKQGTIDDVLADRHFRLGVPKPGGTPEIVSVTGDYPESATKVTSFYRFTYVNQFGEEGDASDPSDLFDYYSGQTIRVRGLGAGNDVNLDAYGITGYRLYRAVEGQLRFVAEHSLSDELVNDRVPDISVGSALSSEDYYVPPANLENLHIMSNGIALGSVGRRLYASEPYNPNAWPYSVDLRSTIVAISSYDNTAVILTDEYPELATIYDPRNLTTTVLAEREPCVARRSVVQGYGGVIYAAPSGLFYIGSSGPRMLTDDYLDERDWQALNPRSFTAAFRDGEYIAFYDSSRGKGGWVFDLREPNAVVRRLSQWASAAYTADGTDELYLIQGSELNLYQGGARRLPYTWRSKRHGGGSPFALTSGRLVSAELDANPDSVERAEIEATREDTNDRNVATIQAATGPRDGICGAIGQRKVGDTSVAGDCLEALPPDPVVRYVGIKVYGDTDLVHEERIEDEDQRRLNYADRKRIWEYELSGDAHLTQIDLASSFTEMHTGN